MSWAKCVDVDWTCHGLVYERVISESVCSQIPPEVLRMDTALIERMRLHCN